MLSLSDNNQADAVEKLNIPEDIAMNCLVLIILISNTC